jgi:histidyl-tRNA synthetase
MFTLPRGTQDILPEEQPYWRFVQGEIERLCRLYGYSRIDTPIFEDTALFVRSVGEGTDIVDKEMYTFEDKGGASLTLRPEGTAPVCRAYLQHGLQNRPQPVKLYYIAPIFRYDRPQAGRYRQHHQFGYEAIGEADPALDAEVIDLAWNLYLALGLTGLSIQLNSIGCQECRPAYLERLVAYYRPLAKRLCRDCQARLERNPLRLLDCKKEGCQPYAEGAPRSYEALCSICEAHFTALRQHLSQLEIPYDLNHRLVRGLDYYTKTVFEVQPQLEGAQSTIGGGGRYDGLIEQLGGKSTPAVGFATGLERVVLNLKRQKLGPVAEDDAYVFVSYLGEEARSQALGMVARLRRAGIPALSAFDRRSLKAQLRQADARGARYTIILGEEELRAGAVTLREMEQGQQSRIEVSRLLEELRWRGLGKS